MKTILRETFLWKIARKTYRKIKFLCLKYSAKYDMADKEHIKHFGKDFPEKIFYVIRRRPPGAGLLSNFHWVLNNTLYAVSKGYVPVVNMQDYKTFYNVSYPIEIEGGGALNAWEYYFEQPAGYSLKDIKNAKNVILGDWDNYRADEFPNPWENIHKYNELVSKYCRFNSKTILASEKKKQIVFQDKRNILGVLHRGTDYKTSKGSNLTASLEQIIEKVRLVFQEEKFDYIFLMTEEQEAVDEFRKVFAQLLMVSDSERITNYNAKDGLLPDIIQKTSSSPYERNLEYLTDTILLSQCDGIIASKVNGTLLALGLNNNKYRYSYIFDLGVNL